MKECKNKSAALWPYWGTAIVLLCYTLWMAFKVSAPHVYIPFPLKIRNTSAILLLLILLQLFYGALMAGSKAALSAPTMLFIFYLAQRASESKSCADSNRETSF
jgi:heme A synthase